MIFHPAYGVNVNIELSTNTRNEGPQLGPKAGVHGFTAGLRAEHDVDYVLCVGMRHVPHLRCSASCISRTQRLRAGLKHVAPTALQRRGATARLRRFRGEGPRHAFGASEERGHGTPSALQKRQGTARLRRFREERARVPTALQRREGTACRAPTRTGARDGVCRRLGLSGRGGGRRVP